MFYWEREGGGGLARCEGEIIRMRRGGKKRTLTGMSVLGVLTEYRYAFYEVFDNEICG